MSTYNGRRGPNVSQYLANLNTIPSQQELPAQHDINFGEGDLDFLTNTEFFDFDSFHPPEYTSPSQHDVDSKPVGIAAVPGAPSYQFNEFSSYPSSVSGTPLQGQYPPQPAHQLPFPAHNQPLPAQPQTGDKRKSSVVPSTADLEEESRFAAEEDKRRRNTAASARFRVKKKQREQALEKQAKDMADKVQHLETKVQQLEMENKWLKGLITDKGDSKSLEALQKENKDSMAEEQIPEPAEAEGGTA